LNPVSGYVASANNRTTPPDYPYHIGSWYALPGRFERISELLESKDIISVEDYKTIQLDQYSKMAEKYMPPMLKALATNRDMNPAENKAFGILKTWDYSMGSKSSAAAI
jgi:penicillin amidase